jgi:hypothetical protein
LFWAKIGAKQPNYGQNLTVRWHRLVQSDTVILADRNLDRTVRGNHGRYRNYSPKSNFTLKYTGLALFNVMYLWVQLERGRGCYNFKNLSSNTLLKSLNRKFESTFRFPSLSPFARLHFRGNKIRGGLCAWLQVRAMRLWVCAPESVRAKEQQSPKACSIVHHSILKEWQRKKSAICGHVSQLQVTGHVGKSVRNYVFVSEFCKK